MTHQNDQRETFYQTDDYEKFTNIKIYEKTGKRSIQRLKSPFLFFIVFPKKQFENV